jgi:ABC-type lipoprotein export system ATPase subunit
MSLLELDHVTKAHRTGGRVVHVLEVPANVSIDPGELVGVWGLRGSGRTSLLRLAAGIDAPDAGTVHFDGRDLSRHGEQILGRELAYCEKSFRTALGPAAIDELIVGLLLNGVGRAQARSRTHEVLERVAGESFAARRISELDSAERIRLAIAQALTPGPRLLLVDEPVAGVELHQRDDILRLLRSLADEGIAVLMTVGDTTGWTGADQKLTIGEGELGGSGQRELEPVVDLAARRRATG